MVSSDVEDAPKNPETMSNIVTEVIHLLKSAGQTLGIAESLTGGAMMKTITSVSGAGAVFRGGIVSYATPLKHTLLSVDRNLVDREGVIHADVAAQMAEGVRKATTIDGVQTTWGIGTTGVAGPEPQDGKPAGIVFIGIASPKGSQAWGPFSFSGSRDQVREATISEALLRLRDELKKHKQQE
ncbi:CinA-like protein [Paramyrothecium foliicola]|nr:CinA-like protein [Paramyrothecium foliicola]